MDVSVLIVNGNAKSFLKRCLASLEPEAQDCAWRIIVMDVASTDGSPEMGHRKSKHPAYSQDQDSAVPHSQKAGVTSYCTATR